MLAQFDFNSQQLRTVSIDDAPWFVAKDVCDILGIGNVSQASGALDEDERLIYTLHIAGQNRDDDEKLIQTLLVSGQNRKILLVSESGLYALIIRSNKPAARKFRKWITSEVLPSIRKTGGYTTSKEQLQEKIELMEEIIKLQRENIKLTGNVTQRKTKTTSKPQNETSIDSELQNHHLWKFLKDAEIKLRGDGSITLAELLRELRKWYETNKVGEMETIRSHFALGRELTKIIPSLKRAKGRDKNNRGNAIYLFGLRPYTKP